MTGTAKIPIDDVTGLINCAVEQGMKLTWVSTRNNALIGARPL
jgi:hypothetical protein